MPLNREQRQADRVARILNFNRREAIRRQEDIALIASEYRKLEAKAYRLKVFENIRVAKELKRREREDEQEKQKQKQEDEV